MQGPKAEGADEVVSDINITPLCDIFVVLLIIFMLTADLIVQTGPDVQLPQSAKESVQPSRIAVTVTYEGANTSRYFIGEKPVKVDPKLPNGFEDFRRELKEELAKQEEKNRDVMVRADKRLLIKDVMRLVQIAQADGAANVAIATRLEAAAPTAP